jgi:L-aminopeptidase/D-esterase-like protein
VPWGYLDPFYAAVVHCVEESVLNALVSNKTMIGRSGHLSPALPIDAILQRLQTASR